MNIAIIIAAALAVADKPIYTEPVVLTAADSGRVFKRIGFAATNGVAVTVSRGCTGVRFENCFFNGNGSAEGALVFEEGAVSNLVTHSQITGYRGDGVILGGEANRLSFSLACGCGRASVSFRGADRCEVYNSIIAANRHDGIIEFGAGNRRIGVRQSILYWKEGDALRGDFANIEDVRWAGNQYCDRAGDGKARIGGLLFSERQRGGFDPTGFEADPLLIGPDNGDYRLRKDSPMLAHRFTWFDSGDVGVVKDYSDWRYPQAKLTKRDEKLKKSYEEQKPFTEDGMEQKRPEIRNGTWYVNGKPQHYVGVWIYPGLERDWGKPDKLGIDHIAYRERPNSNVFAAVGINSAQLSSAHNHAGALLHGGDPRTCTPKLKRCKCNDGVFQEQLVRDYYAPFGDMPWAVDFAFLPTALMYDKATIHALDQRKDGWHKFIPLCPEHPEARAYYHDFFRGNASAALRAGANVYLWEVFNESAYNCQCDYNRREFLRRMKGKYGPKPDFNRLMEDPSLWYDWCVFSAQRYAEVVAEGRRAIEEVDRRKRVYFCEQPAGHPPVNRGMDRRLLDALDVLTLEGGFGYGFSEQAAKPTDEMAEVVTSAGSGHIFNCDFFQAISKGRKPITNNEHYCTRIENGRRVPSHRSDYLTSLWLEVMHGISSSYFYVWDKRSHDYTDMKSAYKNVVKPSYRSSSLLNPFNVKPDDLDFFKTFQEELRSYAEKLLPFPRVKPATVAVFFSKPTVIQRHRLPRVNPTLELWRQQPTWTKIWYGKLSQALYPVKVVFEEDLDSLGAEVKAVVCPDSDYVLPEVPMKLKAFADRGGLVVCSTNAFAKDAWGHALNADDPRFVRVKSAAEAASHLAAAKVPKYAEVEPLDGGEQPKGLDVQVCDRGDFKLVCLADVSARVERKVRLRLMNLDGEGPWALLDGVTRKVLKPTVNAEELAEGFALTLPPQERVIVTLEKVKRGKNEQDQILQ